MPTTIIKKDALCYGKKFGHDFPVVGGQCTQCGIGQNELSKPAEKIEYFVKEPMRGIHSEAHALAKELSEFCGEPKKFGMYLGIIKNIGPRESYRIFAEMRQAKEIKTPGKLFLYLSASQKLENKEDKKTAKEKTKKNKKPQQKVTASVQRKRNTPLK